MSKMTTILGGAALTAGLLIGGASVAAATPSFHTSTYGGTYATKDACVSAGNNGDATRFSRWTCKPQTNGTWALYFD
ncbi:hypothetical protein [Antrihabitans stalactiti]|uniref:Uncharacterized protein n=1 Tax=Antrihabitans stalactiti TaxID=2584121 RepID=A0A848KH37_9NOCA|nr:hypothetical protein [Antrihabitans stalactiti]NMN97481.1 hypothetical protein [Antrihabitans stalactiti]